MGDAVDVPLEAGADRALLLGLQSAAGVLRQHPVRADHQMLQLLPFLSRTRHGHSSPMNPQGCFFVHSLYTTQILISLYFFERFFE